MYSAEDKARLGVAVYSAPSMLNHSCRPNTIPLFIGSHFVLKAGRDIDPEEQLFITYTPALQLLSERQAKLQSGYNFKCTCKRCSEDKDNSKSPEDISKSPVSVLLYYL